MGVNSANKGYIGRNIQPTFGSYGGIDGTRFDFNDSPSLETTPYVRPSEWVTIPGITQGQQIFIGTFAVYNHDSNFVAFTVTGNYLVDWGDGTTGAFSSGVQASKRYDTTTYSGLTSSVIRGYKTLNITITPQSGANINTINLANKHPQSSLSNYVNQWLDIRFSAPNLTNSFSSFFMNSDTVPMGMLEQFDWVNTVNNYDNVVINSLFRNCFSLQNIVSLPNTRSFGGVAVFENCFSLQSIPYFETSRCTATNGMFSNCRSLRTIPPIVTSNSTDMNLMFANCFSLVSVPWMNTSKVTSFNAMFSGCRCLNKIPFFDTGNVTNIAAAFAFCTALKTIPPLNTSKVTTFQQMFRSCISLEEIPLIDTSSGTNLYGMFESCVNLKGIPKLNTSNATNFSYMLYDCYSLKDVPLLDTSKGTNFSLMFTFAYSLKNVPAFDLKNAENVEWMFLVCPNINYFPDFNVSKATNLNRMFASCSSLLRAPNLTLGTAGITFTTNAFQDMFSSCFRLTEVPQYNLSGVSFGSGYASVYDRMFPDCTSLSKIGITGFNHNISISGCKLSGTALNELYTSLAVVGASGSGAKTITVTSNWGAATDDPSIAIAKGWTVTG